MKLQNSIYQSAPPGEKLRGGAFVLRRIFQHIFYIDTVSPCRVVHQNMGYRPDDLSVLNDGASAHE